MKTVYIGIDPGLKGFITVLESDEEITFHPIPTINKGKELDSIFLAGLLKGIVERYKEHRVVFGVENVHALFGASAGSTFNFGFTAGCIEGVLACLGVTVMKPAPKTWQKEMWKDITPIKKKSMTGKTEVIDTKATSMKAARKLYPRVDLRRTEKCKNLDDNKCDSLLMATYLRRMNY